MILVPREKSSPGGLPRETSSDLDLVILQYHGNAAVSNHRLGSGDNKSLLLPGSKSEQASTSGLLLGSDWKENGQNFTLNFLLTFLLTFTLTFTLTFLLTFTSTNIKHHLTEG